MKETPKRLAPTQLTFRELCLKSGNVCAFPGCEALLMDEQGNFIGQLCHIEAAEQGGPRFNSGMTNEERRSASNLMLMCYPHHQITNDPSRYTVAGLREMKTVHERRFSGHNRAARARLAKLKWTSLVGAGVVAGIGIDEIIRRIEHMLRSSVPTRDHPSSTPLQVELQKALRYAPTGAIYWYSLDPLHQAVGSRFLKVFEASGWRTEQMESPEPLEVMGLPYFKHSMLMLFVVSEKEQLPHASQAIHEFFRQCGFSVDAKGEATRKEEKELISFYITVAVRCR